MSRKRLISRGLSLLEIMIAFVILTVAVLTMVGYTALIHQAANEGKRQAIASMEAKSVMEQLKDSAPDFAEAADGGYVTERVEYLLDEEVDPTQNEVGSKSAARYAIVARAEHIAGDIYGLVVTASWSEDGRPRTVVLETRTIRPGR